MWLIKKIKPTYAIKNVNDYIRDINNNLQITGRFLNVKEFKSYKTNDQINK